MKRWVALCLSAVLLCTLLSACGKRQKESEEDIYTGWIATATAAETMTSSLSPNSDPLGSYPLADTFTDMRESAGNDFTYVREPSQTSGLETIRITAYLGADEDVRVPVQIDGKPVVAIGDGVFADMPTLRTLYIPDTVQALGVGILQGTEGLLALHTPLLGANAESAQYLGYLFGGTAYANNPADVPASLVHLSVGEGMTALPAYALYECNDLVTLRFSSSIKAVEKFAAFGCTKLEAVNLDALETVGEYAFGGTALNLLFFGTSLTSIGRSAFEGCGSVSHARLPFVGGSATENGFLGYIFGAEVADYNAGYVPASLKEIWLLEGCTALAPNAFYECAKLWQVVLPKSLSSIGTRAFYGCESLHTVALPDACGSIGAEAFYGCFSLRNPDLGEGLTTIGVNAFYYCISLEKIVLPKTVTALPASAFAGCRALRSVDLGGVRTVGAQAFRGCNALSEVIGGEELKLEKGNESLKALLKEKKK